MLRASLLQPPALIHTPICRLFPPQGSGQGCPLLRASNQHSFTVRVLRARRAPGRSLPILLGRALREHRRSSASTPLLPSMLVSFSAWQLGRSSNAPIERPRHIFSTPKGLAESGATSPEERDPIRPSFPIRLGWKRWARRLSTWRNMPTDCQTKCRGTVLLVR
jgi:hypothetical protein